MFFDSDDLWSNADEKALLGRRGKRSGVGRIRNSARKLLKRPAYDGDGDGFITNPFTGRDEIPWNREVESAEDAIKKFFGGKLPAALNRDFLDDRKTPFAGKLKVSKLRRGDIVPDGFHRGIDSGSGKQFQIAKISKLGDGRTRIGYVDLADPKRSIQYRDIGEDFVVPNVRRPIEKETTIREPGKFPKLPKYPAQGTNLGPYDLRPEDRQRFGGLELPGRPPKTGVVSGQSDQPKLPIASQRAAEPEKTYTWPMGSNGRLKPVETLSDDELKEATQFLNGIPESNRGDAVKKMLGYVAQENNRRATKPESSLSDKSIPEMFDMIDRGEITYEDIAREQLLRRYGAKSPSKDEIESLAREIRESRASAEFEDHRKTMWEKFKTWIPSMFWKGGLPGGQGKFTSASDQVTHERWRSDYIVADIMDDPDNPGKFTIGGRIWDWANDQWDEYFFSDTADEFESIEDAQKYIEDLDGLLEDGFDISDPDQPFPDIDQISRSLPDVDKPTGKSWKVPNRDNEPAKGRIRKRLFGNRERSHNFIPQNLEEARRLFTDKWNGRRRNEDMKDRIDYFEDQITELRALHDRMWDEWEMQLGGVMNDAWAMDAVDFAKMARDQGMVDTIQEGLTLHEEIMDAWDQVAADQEEIGMMISELVESRQRVIKQWNDKNSRGVPGFEEPWN